MDAFGICAWGQPPFVILGDGVAQSRGLGKQQAEKGGHSVYFQGAFDVRVDLDLLCVRSAQGSSEGPTAGSPLVLMLHDHICHVRALALLSVVLALLRPPQCFPSAPLSTPGPEGTCILSLCLLKLS